MGRLRHPGIMDQHPGVAKSAAVASRRKRSAGIRHRHNFESPPRLVVLRAGPARAFCSACG
jgi:hypothetical protein